MTLPVHDLHEVYALLATESDTSTLLVTDGQRVGHVTSVGAARQGDATARDTRPAHRDEPINRFDGEAVVLRVSWFQDGYGPSLDDYREF